MRRQVIIGQFRDKKWCKIIAICSVAFMLD